MHVRTKLLGAVVLFAAAALMLPLAGEAGRPLPATGPVQIVLQPSTSSNSAPEATIYCVLNLTHLVHYSSPYNDMSWHWDWTCDEAVTVTGHDALYLNGYPEETKGVDSYGTSKTENIRYGTGCHPGPWYGQIAVTFSAPGYTPASYEGSSRTNDVTCN